jgi:hypothetical protein
MLSLNCKNVLPCNFEVNLSSCPFFIKLKKKKILFVLYFKNYKRSRLSLFSKKLQHVKIFLPLLIYHLHLLLNITRKLLKWKKKLIEGPNRHSHFWKRTIQWLFHQNFVLIEQMVYSLMLIIMLIQFKFGHFLA